MATLYGLTGHFRRVTAFVLARFIPDATTGDIDTWLAAQTPARRWAITSGVLVALFGAALLAAAFGPAGLAVYFLAVVILFR